MEAIADILFSKINYWIYIVLMMIGLYAMITKRNLIKKIIGMNILQTAIILFYVSLASKRDGTLPIIMSSGYNDESNAIRAADYMNPLPHVLMLTAIVVAVATLGVALALAIKVYRQYGTLEEDEIVARIRG
jgi:multicomponent Na+:H+ antiporter subunit C